MRTRYRRCWIGQEFPFISGQRIATGVEEGKLNFAKGLSVKVMRIGLPWAATAMKNYDPADEPKVPELEESPDLPVRCPHCNSEEIIFDRLIPDPTNATDTSLPQYAWSCASCGYGWKDDGIAKEG